jgi:hypothetical protein
MLKLTPKTKRGQKSSQIRGETHLRVVSHTWPIFQSISALNTASRRATWVAIKDENGRKTPQLFSTFTFEYGNESENGKAGHENERELTEYREFRKRTNSSEIMSNTVGIRKFNTKYRSTMHNN